VDAATKLASIASHQVGTNMGIWYDVTMSGLPQQVAAVTPQIVRWPGGSLSDTYHWQNQTDCAARGQSGSAYNPNSTFDNFMQDIVIPGNYQVAITANYGSNTSCSGGGDPHEAAAWVAYAKSKGYNQHTRWWTVGNEVNGGWEFDLHTPAHDATTDANAMSGPNGYYALMKAADPTAQVGAWLAGGGNWDAIVLATLAYDFVEFHWYAQQPANESDQYLLYSTVAGLNQAISNIRAELAAAGVPDTPILIGEINSVAYNQGKQTVSIVNALFTGMMIGEALNNNVMMTWWFGAGGTQGCGYNNSSSLYGWQNWGGYDLVAANTQYGWNDCNGSYIVPEGTVFPSGNAFKMAMQFATPGNSMLKASVNSSLPDVRAYAATSGTGYSVMLFNLNQTTTSTVTVGVTNGSAGPFQASTVTYGKAQYDNSKNNVWTGPVSATLGSVSGSATVTLPPWSITVLKLQ
jgi:alpha-L-arabinofuranosidase